MVQVTLLAYRIKFNKMKLNKYPVLIFILSLFAFTAKAQIEKVYVETYYISDSLDAMDTDGGFLEEGSITYRIYVDLVPGSKVQKIYGDINHALIFKSTNIFFNNIDRGQTFGKDFSKSWLGSNTVALDSYVTLGMSTKPVTNIFGVPKNNDSDGSFVGGINNDGGSIAAPNGLLVNNDPDAGIPLTTSDGNEPMTAVLANWGSNGFISANGDDSTIFGSVIPASQFISFDCSLQNDGTSGVNPDSNFVLLAQLTTKGQIEFELNLEIIDTNGNIIKCVANDSILLAGEQLCNYLKFPYAQMCGCPDPTYLEYLENRDCDNMSLCQNIIVFGCMDTSACNYDPSANFNIQSLCCYPGLCNDRDLALVCPQLVNEKKELLEFDLFPNPALSSLNIQFSEKDSFTAFDIYNSLGVKVAEGSTDNSSKNFQIDISKLTKGVYMLRVYNTNESNSKIFVKN